MKAAIAFKALEALHAVMTTKEVKIPSALWSQVMSAEVALRFALEHEDSLRLQVEADRQAEPA